jgi:predicted membrane channel-forming protein YqfA (hemolysin III family)
MDNMQMNQPSWRKPAGMALILLLIAVWAVLVASAASLLNGLPWPLHAIYYVVTGIVWILPLKPLLRWMETGRWRD